MHCLWLQNWTCRVTTGWLWLSVFQDLNWLSLGVNFMAGNICFLTLCEILKLIQLVLSKWLAWDLRYLFIYFLAHHMFALDSFRRLQGRLNVAVSTGPFEFYYGLCTPTKLIKTAPKDTRCEECQEGKAPPRESGSPTLVFDVAHFRTSLESKPSVMQANTPPMTRSGISTQWQ